MEPYVSLLLATSSEQYEDIEYAVAYPARQFSPAMQISNNYHYLDL